MPKSKGYRIPYQCKPNEKMVRGPFGVHAGKVVDTNTGKQVRWASENDLRDYEALAKAKDYVFKGGRYAGKSVREVPSKDLMWMECNIPSRVISHACKKELSRRAQEAAMIRRAMGK